ncbi:MAG: metalloregulator ArsR/SmtB family transcription factor [Chloroflexota bacterium]
MDTTLFEAQAEFCKAMGNAARLQILHLLRAGEKTVGELMKETGLSQPAVSRQLAALRSVGVVTARRQRQEVAYRLTDPRIGEVCDMVRQVLVEQILSKSKLINRP